MNARHTPEPIFFRPTASENQGVIYGENGKTIAVLYDRTDGYGELFSAAPLGYELAELIMKYAPSCPKVIVEKAGEFLFQAEGRANG